MFYVYILQGHNQDKFYVGQTNNLENRLKRHNNGFVKSTKPHRPWKIVYFQEFNERSEAIRREAQIKAWKSKIKIKELVEASRS